MSISQELLSIGRSLPFRDDATEGVILTGSHATGTANEHSDVDLLVICDRTFTWRKFYRAGSYDVDLFVISTYRAREIILKREQPQIQMIGTGILLDDRSGIVRQLLYDARVAYELGPPPPDPQRLRALRHRVISVLDDCASCTEANASAVVMMICGELKDLSDIYLNTVGKWCLAEKRMIDEIHKHDSSLATHFVTAAAPMASVQDRTHAFREIVRIVLEPYGGPLRYFETKRPRAILSSAQESAQ